MPDILIADDHSAVRLGLELLTREAIPLPCCIDFAQSGQEVLDRLQEKEYMLLLSDLMMPDQKGISLVGQALDLQPELRIIVISMGAEQDFAGRCLQAGASAYLNKSLPDTVFLDVISSVYEDRRYQYPVPQAKPRILDANQEELQSFEALSNREREIALLLLEGKGVLEIANALAISPSTASTLKGRIFRKLDIQSVMGLNRLAYQQGLRPDGAAL
ncbi:response regulator [Taibaiella koreensis]|uniref:response regulator n=1 Tax=Taibaiella koreensis TaxID=1268548 RepID=UPI000E59C410|nr:response regulator transcription factor [Taibaiella koreensis]